MIRPQAVNVAVVRNSPDGWRVILIQRAATESYPLAWGLLSGTRHGDESLVATAFRELQEELSVEPQSLWSTEHLITFYDFASDSIWHAPVLVAVTDKSEFAPSGEIADFGWFDGPGAIERVHWKSLRRILPELFDELLRFPAATWERLVVPAANE